MKTTIPTEKLSQEQMEIKITSRDFPVTEGIETKIHEKINSLNKFAKGNKDVKVSLHSEPIGHKVEVSIQMKKTFLKAQSTSDNLYKSIDLVVENLKNQMSKLSKISKSKQKRKSLKTAAYDCPVSDLEETVEQPLIAKRKVIPAKPMLEEEAILQMEALNHRSFIFIDADTFKPTMAYKRHDGKYGIIEIA